MRDWQHLILRTCAARGAAAARERTFLLAGRHEPRVNISAQQHRALNLIAALLGSGRLKRDGGRLIVAGAGVGGWAAAVAAAHQGIEVHLLDEHGEPVTPQRAATHRPVHPSLYDWPVPGSPDAAAGLAFCNWRSAPDADDDLAGTAARMRQQVVTSGLADLAANREGSKLRFHPHSLVCDSVETPDAVQAQYFRLGSLTSADGDTHEASDAELHTLEADVLLIATGFGIETHVGGELIGGSYWQPPAIKAEKDETVRILGDGDGALNEVLNLVLGAPDLKALLGAAGSWAKGPAVDLFRERLRHIEARHQNAPSVGTHDDLADPALNVFDDVIQSYIKPDSPNVVLVATRDVMKPRPFLLNRFLVSRLIAMQKVTLEVHAGKVSDTAFAAQPGMLVKRVGPTPRKKPALPGPAVHATDVARLLERDPAHDQAAGPVAAVMDMTRHAWWRAGHHGSILTRSEDPDTHPKGLRLAELVVHPTGTLSPALWKDWPCDDIDAVTADTRNALRGLVTAVGPGMPGAGDWGWERRDDDIRFRLDVVALVASRAAGPVAFALGAGKVPGAHLAESDKDRLLWVVATPEFMSGGVPKAVGAHLVAVAQAVLASPPTPSAAVRHTARSDSSKKSTTARGYTYEEFA